MENYQLYKLLESIEGISEISEDLFKEVLSLYNITEADYREETKRRTKGGIEVSDENWLELRREIFDKGDRNYFTICSKTDFNNLVGNADYKEWQNVLIYHPLNDHSRRYLKKGDILFCYRQGQFESLSIALEERGIYGVGVAVSNPMVLFPDEQGHNKYGIIVAFPILLQSHLQLRNIQMHPQTIDLTPYNGNRNDALQHIPEERHYKTLLSLIMEANKSLRQDFEYLLGINIEGAVLPDEKWSNRSIPRMDICETSSFDVDHLVNSLKDGGLIYNRELVVRFAASLCAKPFVILTGLSGSGKTQLALNFARWLCKNSTSHYALLKKALCSERIISNYEIVYVSEKYIEVINSSGTAGKIIPIPTKVIYEWYDALIKGEIDEERDPKEARHVVGENSSYQKYIYGFYNEISKIAKEMKELSFDEQHDMNIKQFEIIPVGADWTNREPLLGYPNALQSDKYVKPDNGVVDLLINAKENPNLPFFLILDEMNLSHVERYFADFLSVMETGEDIRLYDTSEKRSDILPKAALPSNLFIIGTVNIDETTYMFSPKVLDRANTIEFRISKDDMKSFFKSKKEFNLSSIEGQGHHMAESFLDIARNRHFEIENNDEYDSVFIDFFEQLSKLGTEFGYRNASEIHYLINQLLIIDSNLTKERKIDIAVTQKMLPKLHGSRRKLCPVLITLAQLCVTEKIRNVEAELFGQETIDYSDETKIKYPLSLEKISRMYRNAIDNGYASYAEA
jgi:hypothetical protein